jgi:hypothetical protein
MQVDTPSFLESPGKKEFVKIRRKSTKSAPMPNSFTTIETQEGEQDLSLKWEYPFIWKDERMRSIQKDPVGTWAYPVFNS